MVSRFGGNLDLDERIELTGCKNEYEKLQECADKNKRDWRKCKLELSELSKCLYRMKEKSN